MHIFQLTCKDCCKGFCKVHKDKIAALKSKPSELFRFNEKFVVTTVDSTRLRYYKAWFDKSPSVLLTLKKCQ